MKKILLILPFALYLLAGKLVAQTVERSVGQELLQVTPKEKLFVHYNSSILFPGEYLYYQVYLLEADTHRPSKISKVAYLELIGEKDEQVFRHPLPLSNGRGHGDFFVPTDLPSGNYKLVGYTNWMRNSGNLFEGDLVVINPFRGDQTALTAQTMALDSLKPFISPEKIVAAEGRDLKQQPFTLHLDKQRFGPREMAVLTITSAGSIEKGANLSISVRKLDSIRSPDKPEPIEILNGSLGLPDLGDVFLPEFRGRLVFGKIEPNSPGTSSSLANVKVAFSVPGDPMLFKVATTDESGSFLLSFDESRSSPVILAQIVGQNRNSYKLTLEDTPRIEYSNLDFADFQITREMRQWILDRSVQNQIENSYYREKPDTIVVPPAGAPFYIKPSKHFELDDYTRFPSIEETFVEIIGSSWLRKDNKGEESMVVRGHYGSQNYNLPALLLVDGMMVQDLASVISYPLKRVKSISILKDNFFIGSHIFQGIVDMRTFDGNFWKEHPADYLFHKELQVPEPTKHYFQQTYSDSTRHQTDQLPDFRTQLLWGPQTEIQEGKGASLKFFTSDVPGTYEVEVKGFTNDGAPVSLRAYLKVEETAP